ncbi:hypothetical protein PP182_15890 [Maribacter sp. PR1]|uniref:Selenophosphate synthetase n=1 Tax=Maribacter cobaltidurans TaxID=1178778 RepID=A0ABU7IXF9_9FLAO|nr:MULTISPECIES: hypothetical protein [Maribacter]MDC6390175.1 hypothetical protein [Maribacter sp. PR1]MEE1977565.1 hypothetical protein [Maribacter cobaltidurans]
MKKYPSLLILILLITLSCKEDKPKEESDTETETAVLEKIANANGYENWKDVERIKFTFNVDRDSSHFERTWLWEPKTNDVVFMTHEDTISYNRKEMDSVIAKTDAGFINDKYWMLAPYQLVWDQNSFTYELTDSIQSPMGKENMNKLTIVYGDEGGYTPGDAYDFYFGDDYVIQEWVFRRGNQSEPNMVTSWEDYKSYNGLDIATMHKMGEGNFQLYFTGIEVMTE